MFSLPFSNLRKIEQLLGRVELENLVLIFPGQEENAYLLVYNSDEIPGMPEKSWVAKSLDNLKPDDYARYDKPIVGFSALDVVCPDIPSHGVNFYSIEQTTAFKKKRPIYQENAHRLAQWLWENHSRFGEQHNRGVSKIIELALVKILAERDENLVAIVINSDSVGFPKDLLDNIQWIDTNNLNTLGQIRLEPGTWVVGFEEVELFNPTLKSENKQFKELRTILQQAGMQSNLKRTRLELAKICWGEWQKSEDVKYKDAAFALACEAWLAEQDVEDLIAILPHQDFEHFLRTGSALHISLTPRISQAASRADIHQYSLIDTVNNKIPQEHLQEYRTAPITFPLLSPAFEWTRQPSIDLGPVLYKAGHEAELARTFCLISSDLLNYPEFRKIFVSLEEITNLALRAAIALSLSNPWHDQWRARYPQLLERAYAHLTACWGYQEKQADEPLKTYYRALQEWYGCLQSKDIPRSLSETQSACRDFLKDSEYRTDLDTERGYARRIQDIAGGLLEQTSFSTDVSSEQAPAHFEVAEHLRQIVDSRETPPLMSSPFDSLLRKYQRAHTQWLRLQDELKGGQILEDRFLQLLDEFDTLRQEAYAPAHEAKLVQWTCRQNIQRIERFREAFKLGPMLQLRVLNPFVMLEKQEQLYIEVENIGGATAQDVTITFIPSKRFDFVADSASVSIDKIEPQHMRRVEWEILPKESPLELRFAYHYRDVQGNDKEHEGEEFRIETIPLKSENIPSGAGNPFQAGVAVSGERFFGRKNELRSILNLLLGGTTQPILLRGPRRIGKSSILYHLEHLLTGEGEIQKLGFAKDEEIVLSQIHPVITSLQEIPDSNYIGRWFQKVFLDISKSVGGKYFDEEKMTKDFDDRLPHAVFQSYIDQLFQMSGDIRLLVMIDEWDEQRHLSGLAANLRSIMQAEQRVNWIISSTWTLRPEMGRYSSPFYSQASVMELKEMTWKSAEKMIRDLSDKVGVRWQGDVMVTLLDQTARRPYLIQGLCQKIIDYLYTNRHSLVDRETLNIVLNQFIKTPQMEGQPFAFLWETGVSTGKENGEAQARLYWLGRLILWLLDDRYPRGMTRLEIKSGVQRALQGTVETDDEFFDNEFDEQMTQLEYIFDAIKESEEQRYSFCIPLERQWFRFAVSRRTDALEEICEGVARDFAKRRQNARRMETK